MRGWRRGNREMEGWRSEWRTLYSTFPARYLVSCPGDFDRVWLAREAIRARDIVVIQRHERSDWSPAHLHHLRHSSPRHGCRLSIPQSSKLGITTCGPQPGLVEPGPAAYGGTRIYSRSARSRSCSELCARNVLLSCLGSGLRPRSDQSRPYRLADQYSDRARDELFESSRYVRAKDALSRSPAVLDETWKHSLSLESRVPGCSGGLCDEPTRGSDGIVDALIEGGRLQSLRSWLRHKDVRRVGGGWRGCPWGGFVGRRGAGQD